MPIFCFGFGFGFGFVFVFVFVFVLTLTYKPLTAYSGTRVVSGYRQNDPDACGRGQKSTAEFAKMDDVVAFRIVNLENRDALYNLKAIQRPIMTPQR